MFDNLFSTFNIAPDSSIAAGSLKPEVKRFKKGEIITHQGEIENYIYHIKSGAVQVGTFYKQKEAILDFWFEGDYCSSYMSFLSRKPSQVYIEALAPTVVEGIHYDTLQNMYKDSLLANKIGRLMTEALYIRKTQRELDLLTKSAEERYRDLLEKGKTITEEIPVNKIARYLGIHPESLSRIRTNLR